MPYLLKKIPLVFILIFSFFVFRFLSPSPAQATPQEFIKAVQEGNNLQWYLGGSQGMLATTADALTIAITGAYDENGNLISSGAMQTTTALINSTYHQPASSIDYLAYVIKNSGLTKTAYAQGSGWKFLTDPGELAGGTSSVLLKIWKISRNVVYLFFIIIFVAIGFMIMFRSKLNPQTVVNIQLAMPNIIVSLILVTFSFAICGFIIDFVWIGHRLISAIFFSPASPLLKIIPPAPPLADAYGIAVSQLDILSTLFNPTAGTPGWSSVSVINSLGRLIVTIIPTIGGILTGSIAGLIPLILAFSLLGTGLKIFFGLLTKYVTLILSTLFSPFVFLLSAFPGKSEGIGTFLKTMLSAALTFPATTFMFYLSSYFVDSANVDLNLSSLAPLNKVGILAPGGSAGAVGGLTGAVLEPLVALGILMAATQIPQAIDQALNVKAGIAGAGTPDIGGALRKIPLIGSLLG